MSETGATLRRDSSGGNEWKLVDSRLGALAKGYSLTVCELEAALCQHLALSHDLLVDKCQVGIA